MWRHHSSGELANGFLPTCGNHRVALGKLYSRSHLCTFRVTLLNSKTKFRRNLGRTAGLPRLEREVLGNLVRPDRNVVKQEDEGEYSDSLPNVACHEDNDSISDANDIWLSIVLPLAGFGALAMDLTSFHMLSSLDTVVHEHVLMMTAPEWRHDVAGKFLSNGPIILGILTWIFAIMVKSIGVLGRRSSTQNERRQWLWCIACCCVMYCVGGGAILHGDTVFVSSLKEFFHRERPSFHNSSFSFPSGHTTASFFISGVFLHIFWPLAAQTKEILEETRLQRSADAKLFPDGENNALGETFLNEKRHNDEIGEEVGLLTFWGKLTEVFRLDYFQLEAPGITPPSGFQKTLAWFLWGGITASGRVLADVHWFTDVMAGCCVGIFLTGLTKIVCSNSIFKDN